MCREAWSIKPFTRTERVALIAFATLLIALSITVRKLNHDEVLHETELSGEGRRRWGIRLSPGDRRDPESFKTRRGIVGGWRDYFSSSDVRHAAELLERHSYFECIEAVQHELASTPTELADAA